MSLEVLYKEENEELFWEYWKGLIKSAKASPRYLRANIETFLIMSKDESLLIKDKSFIYLVNNEPAAGVFLPIEKLEKKLTASIVEDYIDAPIFVNRKDKKLQKKVFSIIDDIAKEEGLNKVMFLIDPLEKDEVSYNYLQKYNYLDTSFLNYIINLDIKEDLLKACRENHRRSIKRILNNKDFSVFYMDNKNLSYEINEEYRELHHKCSGKITRPKETFDLQFKKIKDGQAFLVGLKYKEKNIAYVYFEYLFKRAAFNSAADDPEYDKLPLYHILIFKAMEYLKDGGVEYIDTEPPSSPSLQVDNYPDIKQFNIALFKSGFPGDYAQNFRGIKYFSKESFEKDMKNFIGSYSESSLVPFNN